MASVAATVGDLKTLLAKLDSEVCHVPARLPGVNALERMLTLILQVGKSYTMAEKSVAALQEAFGDWNGVRVARLYEVADVLRAKRISAGLERADLAQEFLRRVFGLQNHLEIDWLYDATGERRQKFLDSLQMAPIHTAAVLDLDAMEEPGVPVCNELKRLFSRLGFVKSNPKEADVRELLNPLVEEEEMFPHFLCLRMLANLGCDPKHPQGKPARLLQAIWDQRKSRKVAEYAALVEDFGLPLSATLEKALRPSAQKKATKKVAAKKGSKKSTHSAKSSNAASAKKKVVKKAAK